MNTLTNNSKEMATVVETFIIEETSQLIYDDEQLDKWNTHVKELGLTGQTKIVAKDKSPIPFMHIKKSLENVFETLCPRKVKLEEFSITPIPVEILDLAALSVREKYFDRIEIWYDEKSPDPVCIGISITNWTVEKDGNTKSGLTREEATKLATETGGKLGNYSWYTEKYLLGKWGDVKHSFEELKQMATVRFLAEKGNEFRKAIKEATRNLDDLETLAFDQFN